MNLIAICTSFGKVLSRPVGVRFGIATFEAGVAGAGFGEIIGAGLSIIFGEVCDIFGVGSGVINVEGWSITFDVGWGIIVASVL